MNVPPIIIVAYNSKGVIADCILSIEDSLSEIGRFATLYLVDNDPSRSWETNQYVKKHISTNFLKIIFINSSANLGFSGGCLLAIKKFNLHKNVLLLNPDAYVSLDFFKVYLNDYKSINFDGNKLIGFSLLEGVGSETLSRNAGNMPELFNFSSGNRNVLKAGFTYHFKNGKSRYWLLAAALHVETNDSLIDLFDCDLFLTMEEPCIIKKMYSGLLFVSNARAYHAGGHSYENSFSETKFHRDALIKYISFFDFNFIELLKLILSLLKINIKMIFLKYL